MSQSSDLRPIWRFAYPFLLLLLGTLAYSNTWRGPFLFDGLYHIVNNPGIRDLGNLGAIFSSGYQETRPVYVFSLALCYHFIGTKVWLYHLFNLVLHLGCGVLVYQLTTWLIARPPVASEATETLPAPRGVAEWIALLFVLHPLATESVTYINSRPGLLMAFFGLLSLRSYLQFLSVEGWRRVGSYLLSLLYLLLAVGSKESAAVLPFLFAATVWLCRRDLLTSRRWWLSLVPHVGCLLLLPLLYSWVTNPHPPNPYLNMYPLWAHILTQERVYGWFLLLSVVPFYHNFDYDFRWSTTLWDGSFFLSLGGWFFLLLLAWRWRRRSPLFLLGLLWFGLGLAPTNSLTLADFVAERYLYVPLIGLAWSMAGLVTLGYHTLPARSLRLASAILMVCGVLVLGGLTYARNQVLGDPLALWKHTAQQSPNKARVNLNLGIYLVRKKKFRAGYQSLQRALRLDPKSAAVHYNLGVFYEQVQSTWKALEAYRKAYRLRPTAAHKSALVRAYNRMGQWFFWRRQWKHATSHFRSAIALDPMYVIAHYNLAVTYTRQQQWKQAYHHFQTVFTLNPQHPKAGLWLRQWKSIQKRSKE